MAKGKKHEQKSVLNQWLNKKKKPLNKGVAPMPPDALVPLSYGQERLWLMEQLYPNQSLYTYAHHYHIKGAIQLDLLVKAFELLIQQHEVLRSNYRQEQGQLCQFVQPTIELPVAYFDFKHLAANEKQAKFDQEKINAYHQPFDLANDALLRLSIFLTDEETIELVLVMHHILGDAGSLNIINEELSKNYASLCQNGAYSPAPIEIQYKDFAYWQRGQDIKPATLQFWKNQLTGELPRLNLPMEKPQGGVSFRGKTYHKKLATAISNQVKQFAQTANATPFAVLLACYQLLLYKYTGQQAIAVGTPFANRDYPQLEKLIGFFNETLVLKTQIDSQNSFFQLVQSVNQHLIEALAHKAMPIEVLVNELKPERQAGENPLFQSMFLYNTNPVPLVLGEEVEIREEIIDLGVSKFDLTVFVSDLEEGMVLAFEHSLRMADGTVVAMANHFEQLLEQALTNPQQAVSKLSLLSEAETKLLTETWAKGEEMPITAPNINEIILQHIHQSPDAIAVSFEGKSLTYQELDDWAGVLAQQLLEAGLTSNQFVGLYTHRSLEMAVGIWAILKAGAAYLPLDISYPEERIRFMLSDTQANIILAEPRLVSNLDGIGASIIQISPFDNLEQISSSTLPKVKPEGFAYIIYTSGSTGKPKGVAVSHQNLVHSTTARWRFYEHQPTSFLLLSSFSFDSSIVGIFWTLCNGGELVLPPARAEQDIEKLAWMIEERKVSHTLMLPSLYQAILSQIDKERLHSLNTVMVAGEACSSALVSQHFQQLPAVKLYNEYGPTEASVWCIAHELSPQETSPIPIGKPIANTSAFIFDVDLNPVPAGVVGELYIGGNGLTAGYLNRPELTAERFIEHPLGKLYKTGDLAKFRPNGLIDFMSRVDHQIKIRGFRVELDEIREVLLKFPAVEDAVIAVVKEQQRDVLVAYLQSQQQGFEQEVVTLLKKSVPPYMVPSAFLILNKFPKLPNGKIDLKKLPALEAKQEAETYAAPSNEIEALLAQIWEQVLKRQSIGIHDNFFDIGGDSILSIQIVSEARKQQLAIGATQLFEYPTIAELAQQIHWAKPANTLAEKAMEYPFKFALNYQQQAFLFHHLQQANDQGLLHLAFDFSGEVEAGLLKKAWEAVMQQHPVLRTTYHWPTEEAPYQQVHEQSELHWVAQDLSALSEAEQQETIAIFKARDAQIGLQLGEQPIFRLALFQLAPQQYQLIWTCHHISLDGWSGTIIFRDVMEAYQALKAGKSPQLLPVPHLKSYFDWKGNQGMDEAQDFWQQMMQNAQPTLFAAYRQDTGTEGFEEETIFLPQAQVQKIEAFAKETRLTVNTLMQGLWMLTLARFFNRKDISLGLTLTGRSGNFEGIERITGLLMNVLPFRKTISSEQPLALWLQELQQILNHIRAYEQVDYDDIQAVIGRQELFDSLFVFGNFLTERMDLGDLVFERFQGGFSSSYPLTIRVNPSQTFEINLRYNQEVLKSEAVAWLLQTYSELLDKLDKDLPAGDLLVKPPYIQQEISSTHQNASIQSDFHAPNSPVQLQLSKIWNDVLQLPTIDRRASFFDLGGSSQTAIQLLNKVEQAFGKKISPALLLRHPSIEAMAKLLASEEDETAWSSIVPMKTTGDKAPLFCIHSGGAHVMFYKGIAQYMSADRPVYAIEPKGIDGSEPFHESITAMAEHYVQEIQLVQPEGPYHILGTCFSNAVGLEMAHLLQSKDESIAHFFIIDSAPAYLVPPSPNGEQKPISRMLAMVAKGDWAGIAKKFRNRYIRQQKSLSAHKRTAIESELDEMVESLNELYVRYTWRPINEQITLIRSTEFSQRKDKQFHLDRWRRLALGGLQVHEVEGHHLTLFEEPEVQGLAKVIGNCLAEGGS